MSTENQAEILRRLRGYARKQGYQPLYRRNELGQELFKKGGEKYRTSPIPSEDGSPECVRGVKPVDNPVYGP